MIVDTLEEQILEMISIANMIAETLEEQKEELELSMTESKSQTTLRKEMDKVRKELLEIIAEVANETGAGVVLFRSAIVIAVKKLEISKEVLKRLNKRLPVVEVIFAQKKQ